MKRRIFNLQMTMILLVLLCLSCFTFLPAEGDSFGGSGSEIVGVVSYEDSASVAKMVSSRSKYGSPFANCNVYIHPRSFLADTGLAEDSVVAHTDESGAFKISNVRPGEHLVYVKDIHGNGVSQIVTVENQSSKVNMGRLIARRNASIKILYAGSSSGRVLFYFSIRGTGLTVGCTQGGVFAKLDDIPTGTDVEYMITIRMYYPFSKGLDIGKIRLLPGEIREFVFDELTK